MSDKEKIQEARIDKLYDEINKLYKTLNELQTEHNELLAYTSQLSNCLKVQVSHYNMLAKTVEALADNQAKRMMGEEAFTDSRVKSTSVH